MATLRIGSFNVENLFRRARLLNYQDNDDAVPLLEKLAELQGLLRKTAYGAADKTRIARLIRDLRGFVTVNEYSGRLLGTDGRVVANGRDEWYGAIDPVFAKFDEVTRKNTAWVIRQLNADVLSVVEVEDRLALDAFSRQHLKQTAAFAGYPYNMLVDGNDQRGIDVGVFSRFPIAGVRSNIFAMEGNQRIFSRDCLEVQIELPGNKGDLHVLVNHFKSKGYGAAVDNDRKRKRQADEVRAILKKRYDVAKQRIVVAGDFNDTPGSDPIRGLYGGAGLKDALALGFADKKDRWTYEYRGALDQIDYMLVSTPMQTAFRRTGVERRGMFKIAKITNGAVKPYTHVTKPTESASDHAGIWAEFDI